MNMKRTQIATTVIALLAAPLAMAQDPLTESYSVRVQNSGSTSIDSSLDSTTTSTTNVTADIPVTSKSQAVVDDKQILTGNGVTNTAHDNNANVGGSAGHNASGNIGDNQAAGDNNMQDNAAAISAADAYLVFGSAESRTSTTQITSGNGSVSEGSNNTATVGSSGTDDGAFSGASGNIGVNVVSGNGNMQKNNLAISTAPSRASIASVQNVQRNMNNSSTNSGTIVENGNGTTVGNISIDLNGGTGTFNGTHEGASYIPPDQPPENHAFTTYQGTETGDVALAGTVSGTVTLPVALNTVNSQNNANLGGSALSGASGNIGVNISAGNNNLQNNSLSLARSQPTVSPPTPQ